MDNNELPKGMYKLPEEYADPKTIIEKTITHTECNYSHIIRKALEGLVDNGLDITIKRLELTEEKNLPSLIALILEVRSVK